MSYGPDGLYIVMNTANTTNTWVKNHFTTNGINDLHNFYGNINSPVWNPYGYANAVPFKALIDMDGNLRKNGNWWTQMETPIQQLIGYE